MLLIQQKGDLLSRGGFAQLCENKQNPTRYEYVLGLSGGVRKLSPATAGALGRAAEQRYDPPRVKGTVDRVSGQRLLRDRPRREVRSIWRCEVWLQGRCQSRNHVRRVARNAWSQWNS